MNVFISGGCKNGKSHFAQREAKTQADACGRPLYYVATMIPADDEDRERIKRHIADRDGWGFTTLERGTDISGLLDRDDVDREGVFLVDSVTALLGNEMFSAGGEPDMSAAERCAEDLARFAEKTGNCVFVSDFIYDDAEYYDELTEMYRKGLAHIDRRLAQVCDRVIEAAFGCTEIWK